MHRYLKPDQEAQSQQLNYDHAAYRGANYAEEFVDYPNYETKQPAQDFVDNRPYAYEPEERGYQRDMNLNLRQQPYYGSARDYNSHNQSYPPQFNSTPPTEFPKEEFANLSLNEQNLPRRPSEQIRSGGPMPIPVRETSHCPPGYNYSNYPAYPHSTPTSYVTNNITKIVTKNITNYPAYPLQPPRTRTAQNFHNNSTYQPISTPQHGKSYPSLGMDYYQGQIYGQPQGRSDHSEIPGMPMKNISIDRPTSIDSWSGAQEAQVGAL